MKNPRICQNSKCDLDISHRRSNAKFCSRRCGKLEECRRHYHRRKITIDRWNEDNPDRVAAAKRKNKRKYGGAYSAKRRAAKKSGTCDLTALKCIYSLCSRLNALTKSSLQVDHIEPLNHADICGLESQFNLQLLDGPMNLKKSNRRDYITPMDKLRNAKPHSRYPQTVTSP